MLFNAWAQRKPLGLVIAALSLSGCAGEAPEVVVIAPPLAEWGAEAQAEVADELEACADCDATVSAIGDYISLRDGVRALGPVAR